MWRQLVAELEVVKTNQVPVGRFFLVEDDADGALCLFASVRDQDSPERFVAVGLSGKHAFHLYPTWTNETCLLLPFSSEELFVNLGTSPKKDKTSLSLGRLMFLAEIPPYFCASWEGPGVEVRHWARVCIKTWTVNDIRVSRLATDDWSLSIKDQTGNWASFAPAK